MKADIVPAHESDISKKVESQWLSSSIKNDQPSTKLTQRKQSSLGRLIFSNNRDRSHNEKRSMESNNLAQNLDSFIDSLEYVSPMRVGSSSKEVDSAEIFKSNSEDKSNSSRHRIRCG